MKSKIAMITGGSRGIGKATALNLAKKGVDIVLTYFRKQVEAEQVIAEIQQTGQKAVALQLDTSDITSFNDFSEQVKTALEQHWQRDTFDFL